MGRRGAGRGGGLRGLVGGSRCCMLLMRVSWGGMWRGNMAGLTSLLSEVDGAVAFLLGGSEEGGEL